MKPIYILLLLLINAEGYAQWNANPAINNAVCNFTSNQMNVQMTSDGAGGAICTWVDTRNGSQDIYAQRINASGVLQWNVDGIAICNAISDQYAPQLIPDGSGGAIIAWYDNRSGNYDIYAQRISASGIVQWSLDGVAISTAPGNQNAQQLVSDGAGGAIIVWSDGAGGGPNADINAQRINAAGTTLWSVSVCNANSLQNNPQLISDGAGGAIITWEDWRNFGQADIYAQHVSFNGFTTWTFNGVPICTESNFAAQYNTKIVSDGGTGAIISWQDNRSSSSGLNIYAQKVNATGTVQWATDGIVVCDATGLQGFQQMIADGSGGVILAWEDRRDGGKDIYAQRINNSGIAQWTANGIAICSNAAAQNEPQIVARISGGAVIVWSDDRNAFQQDIYAQSIDAGGMPVFTIDGVPVANESNAQFAAQLISDGADGAIIAWQDLRSTTDYDIYSSRLFSSGTLPVKLNSFSAIIQNKNTLLQWQTSDEQNVAKFNLQRSLDGISFTTIGTVNSTGNSTITKNYSYTDYSLNSITSKAIYYRLQIVDIDTKTTYSKIEIVKALTSLVIQVSPNPASDNIMVSSINNTKMLSVVNIKGQILKTISLNGSFNQIKIDVKELPAGIYFIKAKAVGENQEWTKQFIKE